MYKCCRLWLKKVVLAADLEVIRTPFKSTRMSSSLEKFTQAKEKLNNLPDLSNDLKLKLYGFYKQATVGPCNVAKPSAFDFVGKAKWDAWNSIGSLSKDEAMKKYASLVNELMPPTSAPTSEVATEKLKYDGISYVVEGSVTKITLCRPHKKNAVTFQMYKDFTLALKEAGENETSLTVLTGEGDYFSSGNDLSNFASIQGSDVSEMAKTASEVLKSYIAAFIDFPKPLIAAVNGPAIGIAVTCLGLCDVVYASDKAVFHTPFSLLGQTPEGCSSYTFPKIMGYSLANEVLMLSKKLTAVEAQKARLVSEVFPHSTFKDDVHKRITEAAAASKYSLMFTKQLSRGIEKEILHKVNAAECERLIERWQSADCMEAIMTFFQRKSNL